MKFLFLSILLITLQGCANQPLSFQPDTRVDYLELCLNFAREMENEDKLLHLDAVNTFIDEYNAGNSFYRIRACSKGGERQVKLTIQETRYVPPKEQAMYVLISGAGIYFLVNNGLGLVWASLSTTMVGVDFSDDLTDKPKTVYRQFTSWPYFHELPRVKRDHMKQFQVFMLELFSELQQSQTSLQKLKVEN